MSSGHGRGLTVVKAARRMLARGLLSAGIIASTVAPFAAQVPTARAEVPLTGPVDAATKFPAWYQDANGTRLELCLDGLPLCAATPADLVAPDGEAFYTRVQSTLTPKANGQTGKALLTLALEAAYAGPGTDQEIAFSRIRFNSVGGLKPGAIYTVTHPYGTDTYTADGSGSVPRNAGTQDIGCLTPPCNDPTLPARLTFAAAGTSRLGPFVSWDPAVAPKAPAGYLGDPNVPHKIVGGPNGNIFAIDGPDVGGPGINHIETDLFTVEGKVAAGASMPKLDPASDGGVKGDLITNINTPKFTGTSGPNKTVNLYVADAAGNNAVLNAAGTSDAAGNYTVTAAPISDGTHVIWATEFTPADPATGTPARESVPGPSNHITIDTAAPVAPTDLALASATLVGTTPTTNKLAPVITGTAEAGSSVSLTVSGGNLAAPRAAGTADATGAGNFSITLSPALTADGSYTVTATATDVAGNISQASAAATFAVDRTAPAPPQITAKPVDPTSSGNVSFTISPNGLTLTCSLLNAATNAAVAGGSPTACGTSMSYTGLADGSYTFVVEGQNALGNTASDSYTFRVDTTKPVVTITDQPAALGKATSASFSFKSSEAGTFDCSLTRGTTAVEPGCIASTDLIAANVGQVKSYGATTPLADGDYTFTVTAKDAAGNTSAPVTATFTVDTTAPVVRITNQNTSATPSFDYTSPEGGVAFECALFNTAFGTAIADTPWVDCPGATNASNTATSGTKSFPAQQPGSYMFRVRGIDKALNFSTPSATAPISEVAFTIAAATPPPPPPAPAVSLSPATLSFSSAVGTATTKAVTVTNTGGAALNLTNVAVTGTGFSLGTKTCAASLAAGASCTINVSYTPADTTADTGSLTLTDNAANSPQKVSLSGNGTAATTPPPTGPVAGKPTADPKATGTASTTGAVHVAINWTAPAAASLPAGTTTLSYLLEQSVNGGTTWTSVKTVNVTKTATAPNALAGAKSVALSLTPGTTSYLYRVTTTAKDAAGAVLRKGAPAVGTAFTLTAAQEDALTYSAGWTDKTVAGSLGGATANVKSAAPAALTATTKGTYKFTGTGVKVLAVKSPKAGNAEIWVDGVKKATVNLYKAATTTSPQFARQEVWGLGGLANAPHTLEIRAIGTKVAASTGTEVALDEVVVMK